MNDACVLVVDGGAVAVNLEPNFCKTCIQSSFVLCNHHVRMAVHETPGGVGGDAVGRRGGLRGGLSWSERLSVRGGLA